MPLETLKQNISTPKIPKIIKPGKGDNIIVPFKLPIILEKEKNRAMAMSSEIISGTHVSGYYNNGEPKTDIERDPGND